jgi:PAS domain-containing protein
MPIAGNISAVADAASRADGISEVRRQEALLKTGAVQNAILTSANFSIIATDEKGIIQLFNVGAECMLGYLAAEVVNKISPSDIHDPQEVMARAGAEPGARDDNRARLPGISLQGVARDRGQL